MATHSRVLAWRIPGTGEPGGLPSMGSHRVRHDWSDLAAAAAFFVVQLSHPYMTTGKTIALRRWTFVGKVKSPLFNRLSATATAKLLQSCLTLCDPIDGSPPGSPIPGILQARTLEWVAISFSNAWKWKVKVKSLSRVQPSETHRLQPSRLRRPWDFPGKNTGVGCHCLLHVIYF